MFWVAVILSLLTWLAIGTLIIAVLFAWKVLAALAAVLLAWLLIRGYPNVRGRR